MTGSARPIAGPPGQAWVRTSRSAVPGAREQAGSRPPRPPACETGRAPTLAFEVFVRLLLKWMYWWNTPHPSAASAGKTPPETRQTGPTLNTDVPHQALAMFAFEVPTRWVGHLRI